MNERLTVGELIRQLKKLDKDAIVLTRGYEGDMDHVTEVVPMETYYVPESPWYYGDYKKPEDADPAVREESRLTKCVYLGLK